MKAHNFVEEVGNKYNRLLVLEDVGRNKSRQVMYKCLCDCGNIKIVCGAQLRNNTVKSCGCLRVELASKQQEKRKIDMVGKKFNMLLVLKEVGVNKYGIRIYDCLCDCGNTCVASGVGLRCDRIKSCGCLNYLTGSNHPKWNLNLTDEDRKDRRLDLKCREWIKAVHRIYDYTCQVCRKRGGNLNAHHLESYRSTPELRTTLSNGITLCKDCHKDFHHQYGYGKNTKEQFESFKES